MAGQTMTSKILARASGCNQVHPGEVVLARVEMFSSLDGTTFIDLFRERKLKVWDPQRVMFCFDHLFQASGTHSSAMISHNHGMETT